MLTQNPYTYYYKDYTTEQFWFQSLFYSLTKADAKKATNDAEYKGNETYDEQR